MPLIGFRSIFPCAVHQHGHHFGAVVCLTVMRLRLAQLRWRMVELQQLLLWRRMVKLRLLLLLLLMLWLPLNAPIGPLSGRQVGRIGRRNQLQGDNVRSTVNGTEHK